MVIKYRVSTNGKNLRVRVAPSENAEVIRTLKDGEEVTVRHQVTNENIEWGKIRGNKKDTTPEFVMMKFLVMCEESEC